MKARRRILIVLAVPVALVVIGVVGAFVYIHFIQGDPPPRLTLDTASTSSGSGAAAVDPPSGSVDGTWAVTGDSIVEYRVSEVLFAQSSEAVGRTSAVTGSFTLSGTSVPAASFTVDMAKVASDEDRRDSQFRGRIMEVSKFPTATFQLSQPIALASIPSDSTITEVQATGELTLHGVKRSVTFAVKAQRSGASIKVNGTIPVTFSDYRIDNPSGGPASVGDDGELGFLLVLAKQ